MSRIEWTRQEGNDVEAMVAMLVNREHPNSIRITPSRGDGGVDILDRGAAPNGGDVVYQVKRYSSPLTAKQKTEIEESLETLMSDPRWASLSVETWCLVTPWDPTPEAEAWLRSLGAAHELDAVWHGLTYVEQLTARFPEIADYYLYGGRSRNQEAYEAVVAYFGAGTETGSLTVPGVARRLSKAMSVLDDDPHYRYELRFGQGEMPGAIDRQGLVMTWIRSDGTGAAWIAVDVIARCAASVEARPITIAGTIRANLGSEFAAAVQDFVDYGAPFTSPPGAYQGELDAPGGLGGSLNNAALRVMPVNDDPGDDLELRIQALDPSGRVLATTGLIRKERSEGPKGIRVVLEQRNHVFFVEDRYLRSLDGGKRSLRLGDFAGEPVMGVRDALRFLTNCSPPNSVRVSRSNAPAGTGAVDSNWGIPLSEDLSSTLTMMTRLLDVLAVIQDHTGTVVRVPDLSKLTAEQVAEWRRAARILDGEEVISAYPEGHAILAELAVEVEQPDRPLGIALPFEVRVGSQTVSLGTVELWMDEPTLVERRDDNGQVIHVFTTPDRQVRFRRPSVDGP